MAIWSLTQERVEKLLKQIGEKQHEIDTLIKLSPKDIWTVDLEAFMDEWNLQLEEEVKRKKKIASITRRPSQKLGIGAGKGGKGKKKRKADGSDSDDSGSDFGPVKKKAKPKKEGLLSYLQQEPVKKPTAAEALKSSSAFGSTAPQKQGTLLAHLVKKKEEAPQTDGGENGRSASADSMPAPAPTKRSRPAAAKPVKKDPLSDDEDSDVFAAVAQEAAKEPSKTTSVSRTARSAKKQAPKYIGSDSDDDSDDLLGDVSSMVKTIGASANGVPMFKATTTARPAAPVKKNSSPIEIDGDTTNYEGLMPQPSPQRPPPRNVHDTIMSSDEDDFDLGVKKPVASRLNAKPAAKPKAAAAKPAPKPKAVVKKAAAQSPAAKAYAKKHGKEAEAARPAVKAKKQITIDSDEDDEMEDADAIANDILSDEDEDEPTPKPASRAPAARPGRRAAAAKPAKYVVSDDEAESDEASEPSFEDDDSE
jgi:DNA topoisomerase-2